MKWFKLLTVIFFFLYTITYTLYPVQATTASGSASTNPNQMGSEETALRLLNQGQFPEGVAEAAPEKSFFDQITDPIKGFIFDLFRIDRAYVGSKNLSQTTVPGQVMPPTSDSLTDKFTKFLGGSTGFYGVDVVPGVNTQNIKDSEKAYEQANFPDGINPITNRR